ncbi:hypothetical protein [uncultured Devosia sp.]|nr:hypothetical protein [uncultured Devosia sp.]
MLLVVCGAGAIAYAGFARRRAAPAESADQQDSAAPEGGDDSAGD